MSATTAKEVKEILKPSIPKWSCGQWYTSPYHVEEEELIYWATFTPHHNPGPEAIQRYITVFDRYYRANPIVKDLIQHHVFFVLFGGVQWKQRNK